MRDAVICHPLRTPVGRYGGALRDVAPQELAATVIRALVDLSGIDPELVDDVILGNAYPSGEFPAIGRVAALDAGLSVRVPGVQVDRRCGSGLYAVVMAAMQVQSGASDVVVAGGAENMSQVEYYATGFRFDHPPASVQLHDRLARGRVTAGGANHVVEGGMLETAENLRREFSIGREEQDELALTSHRRAVAAQAGGLFDDEIVPVTVHGRKGDVVVSADEHPRADSSLEALARLRPVRGKVDPEATVTAGNASGQNDGAAACLVTTSENAERLGLTPMARLVSWALAGVEPERMGIGPVEASAQALARAGLTLADMELIELNEAFAAQVLAVTRSWEFGAADYERLNVNGSGISLGHPVGATGARILATLLHEMRRRDTRYALETMCIGGGQGIAAVVEAVR
ncbi:MAG: acetyl-CoA C-acyltransferase [Streptosporangiales bacterium]|nr:acetyl-CoA C-acyltransferase [Streptosporangiales bacterium]